MPIIDYKSNKLPRARSNAIIDRKWWQKLIFTNKKPTSSNASRSIKTTKAQDWRTLSPDEPPLPFLLSSSSSTTTKNKATRTLTNPGSVVPSSSIKISDADRFTSELAPIFKECQSTTPRLLRRNSSTASCSSLAVATGRELYTIQESSEASHTSIASDHSNSAISIEQLSDQNNVASSSLMSININTRNINNILSNNDTISLDGYETAPSSWSISPPTSPLKYKPIPNIRIIDVKYEDSVTTNEDQDAESLSIFNAMDQPSMPQPKMILVEDDDDDQQENNHYAPIFEWPTKFIPSAEPNFSQDLIGNEQECRLQFCRLVAQAYQQYRLERQDCPKEMFLLFDQQDNIQGITVISSDGERDDYLEFGGSPQYIAPELSICPSFNYEQCDIWALGISLYRMLVGKYPFYANGGHDFQACTLTHRELFRKMFTSDFVLPKTLSADARDLIQRMLSPENARASFDLVMFHPWIKPYVYWSDIVVKDHQAQATAAAAAASRLSFESKKKKDRKSHKRMKKAVRIIRKVIRIIFKGPYPPPASYYDLADPNYRSTKRKQKAR